MKMHGISAIKLDILEIKRDREVILKIIPNGLWVVGANGRMDVFGTRDSWTLVDESEPLSSSPNWVLYSRSPKDRGKLLNRPAVSRLLRFVA